MGKSLIVDLAKPVALSCEVFESVYAHPQNPTHPHPSRNFSPGPNPVAVSTRHPVFPRGEIPCYSGINPEKQAGFSVQNTLLGGPGLPSFYKWKADGFNWGSNSPLQDKRGGALDSAKQVGAFLCDFMTVSSKKRDFLFILRPHEVKVIQELNSFRVLGAFYPYLLIRYFYLLHKSKIFSKCFSDTRHNGERGRE